MVSSCDGIRVVSTAPSDGSSGDTSGGSSGDTSGGLSVASCSLASPSLSPGARGSISVAVQNTGASSASATAVVTLDGQLVTSRSVTVPATATEEYTIEFSAPGSAGTYDVGVTLTNITQSAPRAGTRQFSRAFGALGSLLRAPARVAGCASCGGG